MPSAVANLCNSGELIYYTPVFEIPQRVPDAGLVISNDQSVVTPYVLLVNGKIVNAMHSEVRKVKFDGV
jgi:hypothetical protein